MVLDDRPPKTIRVTACSASENMLNTLDDAWVCWKDSNGILVASEKLNYIPTQAARTLPGFPPSLGRERDATYTYIFLENHGRRSC